ncbi:Uncharacterized protein PECH_004124 [Penicillium ucsense]|uniref:Protein Zds1 C-terminal domain-containing protein n=1 Tax=Penicillium ucsense TaxID=2839758 RepID=A0A8J8WAA0_9EURO|nr:Uncharacterized protein PECM_005531 [Penicillium ucsense]KAF7737210.1 Uncharacterized protein PECH_004124 [Penicillium ucsense]
MSATARAPEASGGHTTRKGHVTHLSISDPSHHVTEAIGHMYDDDYEPTESRRLSYITSPSSESITTVQRQDAGSDPLLSPSRATHRSPTAEQFTQPNGNLRPPLVGQRSFDRDSEPGSPDSTRPPSETARSSFPLNDIEYESNPAAVVQELNNLAAIRRMSMDVAAAGDPDLPSFGGNLSIPSLPPSPSADENDASRLFWVPASLHPELAPQEFRSFLESKADIIKRKSGEFSTVPAQGQGQGFDVALRRKRSMLSRQIEDSNGYRDGAERLERQRSQSSRRAAMLSPNLQELETLVDDTTPEDKDPVVRGLQNMTIVAEEDQPILPPAPPGHSLRRSTRTQYKKASLKKGEKVPYSKRVGRALSESTQTGPPSVASPLHEQADPGVARASTDPTSAAERAMRSPSISSQATGLAPSSPVGSTFNSSIGGSETDRYDQSFSHSQYDPSYGRPGSAGSDATSQSRQWHSGISSNGRSTSVTPTSDHKIPAIVETPPPESSPAPRSPIAQSPLSPDRDTNPSLPGKTSPVLDAAPAKRPPLNRQSGKESSYKLEELANQPQMIPGNSTRTDSLSFIPTVTEERKTEDRKSEGKKSKKDSEGRKSSWHWLRGSEEKEKKKEKESDAKKNRSKSNDKPLAPARIEVPAATESVPKGRESLVLDRLDPKLEDERRKDGVRRASGDPKKEKDGIFSSIFGGGRKKHSGESHHRKNSSRGLSPEPPARQLRPDIDYPWTRFTMLEERAIYRMAHIKLANPRRALYSQVLLSNFMYSYLEKVQQMHPHMVASSNSQKSTKSREQSEEYQQYQRYQEQQQQHQQQQQQQYGDSGYGDSMYDYEEDQQDHYQNNGRSSQQGYDNGQHYNSGSYQHDHSSFGDDCQLDDDEEDDMWGTGPRR